MDQTSVHRDRLAQLRGWLDRVLADPVLRLTVAGLGLGLAAADFVAALLRDPHPTRWTADRWLGAVPLAGVALLFLLWLRDHALRRQIAERRAAEAALAGDRDLLHALMDNLPDPIFFKDRASRFTRLNPAEVRHIRCADPADAIGKDDFALFPAEMARDFFEDEQRMMATGVPSVNRLERHDGPDGGDRWVLATKAPIRDRDGRVTGLVGICRDVTELKRTQDELRLAKEAAEAANRLKSEFLSTVTHELRTPLTSIQGYLELLLDGAAGEITPEQQRFLEIVHANSRRLTAFINDVLDLAKIEAGRLDLELRPVDLAGAVEQVRAVLQPQATAKGLALEIEVPPGVPPVAADPERLHQILVNLAGNAAKFTERGRVAISARAQEGWVEVAVADTGIGIAPDVLPHVFDEFRQADSAITRRFGGSGLGLAIAKQLTELHGGTLAVASEVGVGTTFALRLPTAAPSWPLVA
jgi:PAS domain S-box-containing protein